MNVIGSRHTKKLPPPLPSDSDGQSAETSEEGTVGCHKETVHGGLPLSATDASPFCLVVHEFISK